MIAFDFLGRLLVDGLTHSSKQKGETRLTQAEAIARYVKPGTEKFAKFCGYCGSLIEDRELRQWHCTNEHPGKATVDMLFCLICGDHIEASGDGRGRLRHYEKYHRGNK